MRYCICILLALAIPFQSLAQPTRDRDGLWIGDYKLETRKFEPGQRIKIRHTYLCLNEYDYVYLEGFLQDYDARCAARVAKAKADRDAICETTKGQIRERCTANEKSLNLEITNLSKQLRDAKSDLEAAQEAHETEILKHYVVEAVITTALFGEITVFIIK